MSRRGQFSSQGKDNAGRPNEDRENDNDKNELAVVPTSIPSWIIGFLQGGDNNAWLLKYVETHVFKTARDQIKKKRGLDLNWLVAFIATLNAGKAIVPKMLTSLLHFTKTQVTSSIMIGENDDTIRQGLFRLVRDTMVDTNKSWLSFRGRHDERDSDGKLQPLGGELKKFFAWNGIIFILDQEVLGGNDSSIAQRLIVRYLGHSNETIKQPLDYIQKKASMSEKLSVYRVLDYESEPEERDKRPLSSIDLEPKMMQQIQREVEEFFHKDSKKLYMAAGRPHRLGFLLSGPPGTGKTSLSVGIASHVGVPLVIINLQNMDNNDLETEFCGLPIPCVVLIEDIDASSADVGNRALPVEAKVPDMVEKHEQFDKDDAVDLIN
jgi:chaperone BCS1